ncbi:hypothetical protein AOLI_G00276570 [Acnodon oligacanthus]
MRRASSSLTAHGRRLWKHPGQTRKMTAGAISFSEGLQVSQEMAIIPSTLSHAKASLEDEDEWSYMPSARRINNLGRWWICKRKAK